MKILAVEFSSAQRSVAIVRDGGSGQGTVAGEVIDSSTGAGGALPLMEEVLRAAGLEREQIDGLAIGLGPGSYSGIRAAIALAQGWQLARDTKLVGISSADCLAADAQSAGVRGRISVVIDAQRDEFYLAGYVIDDGSCRAAAPLRLATRAGVREREAAGDVLIGPELTRWFPAGRILHPRAGTLGRLALARQDIVAGEKLEPIYLREARFVKAPPPRILP
jgi:tRNA threonylcarbamoyl adenosine modification protein YeaZ